MWQTTRDSGSCYFLFPGLRQRNNDQQVFSTLHPCSVMIILRPAQDLVLCTMSATSTKSKPWNLKQGPGNVRSKIPAVRSSSKIDALQQCCHLRGSTCQERAAQPSEKEGYTVFHPLEALLEEHGLVRMTERTPCSASDSQQQVHRREKHTTVTLGMAPTTPEARRLVRTVACCRRCRLSRAGAIAWRYRCVVVGRYLTELQPDIPPMLGAGT